MKNSVRIFTVFLIAAAMLSLSACGKVSAPEPIQGSGYPHTYPRR